MGRLEAVQLHPRLQTPAWRRLADLQPPQRIREWHDKCARSHESFASKVRPAAARCAALLAAPLHLQRTAGRRALRRSLGQVAAGRGLPDAARCAVRCAAAGPPRAAAPRPTRACLPAPAFPRPQVSELDLAFSQLRAEVEALFLQAPSVDLDALGSQLGAAELLCDEQSSIVQVRRGRDGGSRGWGQPRAARWAEGWAGG